MDPYMMIPPDPYLDQIKDVLRFQGFHVDKINYWIAADESVLWHEFIEGVTPAEAARKLVLRKQRG